MTPAELALVGAALYGPRWQTEMAFSVGVADRTVRRWAAGSSAVPADVTAKLLAGVRHRLGELQRIEAKLAKVAS